MSHVTQLLDTLKRGLERYREEVQLIRDGKTGQLSVYELYRQLHAHVAEGARTIAKLHRALNTRLVPAHTRKQVEDCLALEEEYKELLYVVEDMLKHDKIPVNHDAPRQPYERYVTFKGMSDAAYFKAQHSDVNDIVNRIMSGNASQLSAAQNNLYALTGKNTYKLPKPLVGMFLHTSLKGVSCGDVPPSPHMCYWVDTSNYPILIYAPDDPHQKRNIAGFYVYDSGWEDGVRAFRLTLWAPELEDATYFGEDAHLSTGLDFNGAGSGLADALEFFHDRTYERYQELYDTQGDQAWTMAYAASACLEIVFNLLLYLDGEPDLALRVFDERRKELEDKISRSTKRGRLSNSGKRARRELVSLPSGNVTLVAPAVVRALKLQEKKLVKKASLTSKSGPDENKQRLHLVSGHWRNQPYGPRDNPEYKRIWIQPFLKGDPDLGVVDSKTYYVK